MSAHPKSGAAAAMPPATSPATPAAAAGATPSPAGKTPAPAATPAPATVARPTFNAREGRSGPGRPAIAGGQGKADPMARYLDLLGVSPGATLDAINIAYFTVLKRFPENPTEEDEVNMQEVRRAYDIVRRRYVPPKAKGFKIVFDKRVMVPLLVVAVLSLGGTFLWMNWNNVKMQMTRYEPGAVLRLKDATAPYGTVTGYEAMHRFPTGAPSPAYSMKLADGQSVWVAERLVVIGMVPAGN